MSGAWARGADAVSLSDNATLAHAARHLTDWLNLGDSPYQRERLRVASAIIRRERKSLPVRAPRNPDWSDEYTDEYLVWIALRQVAGVQSVSAEAKSRWGASTLREAEAALRTLHKRGEALR